MTTITETLSMQVHRLLGKKECNHDAWKWDLDSDKGYFLYCSVCGISKHPDYAHDLNAAAEAEKFILCLPPLRGDWKYHGPYREDYYYALQKIIEWEKFTGLDRDHKQNMAMITATATQRMQAFVKAMGEEPAPVEIAA